MTVANDPVVAVLNEVVRSDSAAAVIGAALQRVLRQLDASPKLMAWEVVPLNAFAAELPESTVAILSQPDVLDLLRRHPDVGLDIIRLFASRLRRL